MLVDVLETEKYNVFAGKVPSYTRLCDEFLPIPAI